MESKNKNLYRLDELSDYKVASHYSDVRGWKLIDADNKTIGKVDNLLVNKAMERVVYLDVEVDKDIIEQGHDVYGAPASEGAHEFLDKDGNNHLIVPIGSVSLDKENKCVVANTIAYDTFKKTNRYNKQQDFDREYERKVMVIYFPEDDKNTSANDDTFYDRSQFNRPD
jgi:hypothetical protein